MDLELIGNKLTTDTLAKSVNMKLVHRKAGTFEKCVIRAKKTPINCPCPKIGHTTPFEESVYGSRVITLR